MEKIDAKVLAMSAVTLLTRLTAHLERSGALPLGWTAQELRHAALAADQNVKHGSNPMLHHDFAAALRRIAELSLQPPGDPATDQADAWPKPG